MDWGETVSKRAAPRPKQPPPVTRANVSSATNHAGSSARVKAPLVSQAEPLPLSQPPRTSRRRLRREVSDGGMDEDDEMIEQTPRVKLERTAIMKDVHSKTADTTAPLTAPTPASPAVTLASVPFQSIKAMKKTKAEKAHSGSSDNEVTEQRVPVTVFEPVMAQHQQAQSVAARGHSNVSGQPNGITVPNFKKFHKQKFGSGAVTGAAAPPAIESKYHPPRPAVAIPMVIEESGGRMSLLDKKRAEQARREEEAEQAAIAMVEKGPGRAAKRKR